MYSEISVAEKKDKQDFPFDTETENDRKKDMACSSCVKHSNNIQKIAVDLYILVASTAFLSNGTV